MKTNTSQPQDIYRSSLALSCASTRRGMYLYHPPEAAISPSFLISHSHSQPIICCTTAASGRHPCTPGFHHPRIRPIASNAAPSSTRGIALAPPVLDPLSIIVFARTTAMLILPFTYLTILLYGRSCLDARRDATRFSKAFASLHAIPSMEYTRGVNERRHSMHASRYLFFFAFAARSSTCSEEEEA